MIEAVMYGMIPRAKSESRERLPPEKRFRKPRMSPWVKVSPAASSAAGSTPGAGMKAPSR
jgi:hypothetical protein